MTPNHHLRRLVAALAGLTNALLASGAAALNALGIPLPPRPAAGRRLGGGSLRRAARAFSVAFSSVAVVALGVAAAAPATASAAPSMNTVGNDTNIAVQGPNHSLHFYRAINGIPGWNPRRSPAPAPPTRRRR
jgi:hypothetical protein